MGERQLAEVCSGGRGRPATRTELDAALDALSGPDGLTGQASTFTRTDVVDALAKRLPVAPSARRRRSPRPRTAADRFLDERAVRVGRDRRLGVDRFSTPELLALERQLVDGATGRTGEGCAVVRPEVVRQVLDRHATAGEDQAAMVRDLTQGGDGVAVVVGRAGSGKTWALGLAREAFELDGYQVLGTAPTGIATVGLADEGFTDARTVDRLLLDLQAWPDGAGRPDGAGGGRGGHGRHPQARPPAQAMRSGPGPRWCWSATTASSPPSPPAAASAPSASAWAPRELTVNRRQVEAWEQRAIDDVRAGNLEQAIAAYAEHDRIRAFEARDDRDRALVVGLVAGAPGRGAAGDLQPTAAPRSTSSTASASGCGPRPASSAPSGWRSATGASRSGMWWCWAPTPATAWAWSTAPPPSSRTWTCPAGR